MTTRRLSLVQEQLEQAAVAVARLARDHVPALAVICDAEHPAPHVRIGPEAAARLGLTAAVAYDEGMTTLFAAVHEGALVCWRVPKESVQ